MKKIMLIVLLCFLTACSANSEEGVEIPTSETEEVEQEVQTTEEEVLTSEEAIETEEEEAEESVVETNETDADAKEKTTETEIAEEVSEDEKLLELFKLFFKTIGSKESNYPFEYKEKDLFYTWIEWNTGEEKPAQGFNEGYESTTTFNGDYFKVIDIHYVGDSISYSYYEDDKSIHYSNGEVYSYDRTSDEILLFGLLSPYTLDNLQINEEDSDEDTLVIEEVLRDEMILDRYNERGNNPNNYTSIEGYTRVQIYFDREDKVVTQVEAYSDFEAFGDRNMDLEMSQSYFDFLYGEDVEDFEIPEDVKEQMGITN